MRRPAIGVMGSGENATPRAVSWARQLGTLIAGEGGVLLNGGGATGVMEAASDGAQQAGGLVVGILPTADATDVSDSIDIAIVTGMGSARNNINVLSSDVVIACRNPEAGTLSEVALAMKAGKPIVLLTETTTVDASWREQARTRKVRGRPEEALSIARDLLM